MTEADLLDATHDPALESWVASANASDTDFPIQNLPFGVFRRAGSDEEFRGGIAIGEQILDLLLVEQSGLVQGEAATALAAARRPALNDFMAMGPAAWSALRLKLSELLSERSSEAERSLLQGALVPQRAALMSLPAKIGDYTDFYASIYHATSVGALFRPDNPLLPNYRWVPIAYHGRSSSIAVSGQEFRRPWGQLKPADAEVPRLQAAQRLDYELEVGVFVGPGNPVGVPVGIGRAESHVFGLCLLNDWSARDIQAWEYQPLGPFLAKNFATTISPWIVTLAALAPFRTAWTRPAADPQPLPYLDDEQMRRAGGIDLQLEVYLQSAQMRAAGLPAQRLSHSNFRHSYWSIAQMVAHHTVNGCNLLPGDLLGSGTQSGPAAEQAGSLLELTSGGRHPLNLVSGESRTFLADGDRVMLRGWCEKSGYVRIGFGEAAGMVLPAAAQNAV